MHHRVPVHGDVGGDAQRVEHGGRAGDGAEHLPDVHGAQHQPSDQGRVATHEQGVEGRIALRRGGRDGLERVEHVHVPHHQVVAHGRVHDVQAVGVHRHRDGRQAVENVHPVQVQGAGHRQRAGDGGRPGEHGRVGRDAVHGGLDRGELRAHVEGAQLDRAMHLQVGTDEHVAESNVRVLHRAHEVQDGRTADPDVPLYGHVLRDHQPLEGHVRGVQAARHGQHGRLDVRASDDQRPSHERVGVDGQRADGQQSGRDRVYRDVLHGQPAHPQGARGGSSGDGGGIEHRRPAGQIRAQRRQREPHVLRVDVDGVAHRQGPRGLDVAEGRGRPRKVLAQREELAPHVGCAQMDRGGHRQGVRHPEVVEHAVGARDGRADRTQGLPHVLALHVQGGPHRQGVRDAQVAEGPLRGGHLLAQVRDGGEQVHGVVAGPHVHVEPHRQLLRDGGRVEDRVLHLAGADQGHEVHPLESHTVVDLHRVEGGVRGLPGRRQGQHVGGAHEEPSVHVRVARDAQGGHLRVAGEAARRQRDDVHPVHVEGAVDVRVAPHRQVVRVHLRRREQIAYVRMDRGAVDTQRPTQVRVSGDRERGEDRGVARQAGRDRRQGGADVLAVQHHLVGAHPNRGHMPRRHSVHHRVDPRLSAHLQGVGGHRARGQGASDEAALRGAQLAHGDVLGRQPVHHRTHQRLPPHRDGPGGEGVLHHRVRPHAEPGEPDALRRQVRHERVS